MWVAKLRIKHDDCVVGSRCKKFNVVSIGVPFNKSSDDSFNYFSHFETLSGREEDIKRYITDIRKDPRVTSLEIEGNVLFFLVKIPLEHRIPSTHYNPRTFFIKPVIVDTQGYELWEIGSWKKELLSEFIDNLQKEKFYVKILRMENTKLNEVYFPQVMPQLTKNQKRAIELAYQHGYYEFPRNIELNDLAKFAGLSLSTFREHLRKAEKKIMPDLVKNVMDEF
ncbi:MAG TPA: helix-turn-helix domain-containing protein [Candidatus Nanoarchaeia archaeon]|nr:helix-turn-helix domain-containing protein [Candidatus Nanoarchaeia archaeon]